MAAAYDDVLRCPACDELLEGAATTVPVGDEGDEIRVDVECSACDAPLAIVVSSALPEALGVDLDVERRRP